MNANTHNHDQSQILARSSSHPRKKGADISARREAIMKPRLMKEFFREIPEGQIPERDHRRQRSSRRRAFPLIVSKTLLQIIKENGKYAGVIRDTPTGPFINLDSPGVPAPAATPALPEDDPARRAATSCRCRSGRADRPRNSRCHRQHSIRRLTTFSFPTESSGRS